MRSAAAVIGCHWLESPVGLERLVGAHFVEPLSFCEPLTLAELEQGGGVVRLSLWIELERIGVEMHLDQREKSARLAVACPEHTIVPVSVVPPLSFDRVDSGKAADEPGLEPLTPLPKEFPGMINMDLFGELSDRPPKE